MHSCNVYSTHRFYDAVANHGFKIHLQFFMVGCTLITHIIIHSFCDTVANL
jgi:hypothetical protein